MDQFVCIFFQLFRSPSILDTTNVTSEFLTLAMFVIVNIRTNFIKHVHDFQRYKRLYASLQRFISFTPLKRKTYNRLRMVAMF